MTAGELTGDILLGHPEEFITGTKYKKCYILDFNF